MQPGLYRLSVKKYYCCIKVSDSSNRVHSPNFPITTESNTHHMCCEAYLLVTGQRSYSFDSLLGLDVLLDKSGYAGW